MSPEQFYKDLETKQRIILSQQSNNCHPAGNASLFEESKGFDVFILNPKFNSPFKGKNAPRN